MIFFFASAGARSAYLTVSEIFPLEVRAQAIAVFFAIAQCFGAIGPIFYGHLIGEGSDPRRLFVGYLIGAGVMVVGGLVEIAIGVRAERKPLESLAQPLSAVSATVPRAGGATPTFSPRLPTSGSASRYPGCGLAAMPSARRLKPCVMTIHPAAPQPHVRRRAPAWARILLSGFALWVAAVVITFATGNANLVPTVILLGSFLVPVTFVVYAFGRGDGVVLTAQRTFTAFIVGGVLGVLGATVLEVALLRQPSSLSYVEVGLIEEAVKLAALWLLVRHLPRYTVRDGMVLGAAVGFGFAALESAGYAFTALFGSHGLSLLSVVETEALRGILAPFGHGLWTAILGGALFATAAGSRRGRPRLRGSLIGWYLLMALLHALWDASGSVAYWLTLLLTGTPTEWRLIGMGEAPSVTQEQVHLYTAVNWALLLQVAVVGVAILVLFWSRTPTVPPSPSKPSALPGAGATWPRGLGA